MEHRKPTGRDTPAGTGMICPAGRTVQGPSSARRGGAGNGTGGMPVIFLLRAGCAILAAILIAGCLVVPASAAVKYSQGNPDFTAAVTGTNEFLPGEETTLNIILKNNGLNLFKQVNAGTISQEDLPNTAKSVKAGLSSENPLVTVKTDPQSAGTILGSGGSATLSFTVKISEDATADEYQLPLTIDYLVPEVLVQEKSDVYQFVYNPATVTIPLSIRVRTGVKADVLETVPENLSMGSEGFVSLTIRNAGEEDGENAVVTLTRSGQSPVIPVDSSVYVGDFRTNGTITCRYKVAIADDAEEQTYPVAVSVTYRNHEGSLVTTSPVTVGIPVMGKAAFTVVSSTPQLAAGSTTTITVEYRNAGSLAVYEVNARISAHDPLTIDDNMAYLGTLGPGESATAMYEVTADKSAEPAEYSFESNLRYRDASGNSLESDTVGVTVEILPAQKGIMDNPVILVVILVVILAAVGLVAYRYRKGAQ